MPGDLMARVAPRRDARAAVLFHGRGVYRIVRQRSAMEELGRAASRLPGALIMTIGLQGISRVDHHAGRTGRYLPQ